MTLTHPPSVHNCPPDPRDGRRLSQADIDEVNRWRTSGYLPRAGAPAYDPESPAPQSIVSGRTKLALVVLAASLISFGGVIVAGYLSSRGLLPWQ